MSLTYWALKRPLLTSHYLWCNLLFGGSEIFYVNTEMFFKGICKQKDRELTARHCFHEIKLWTIGSNKTPLSSGLRDSSRTKWSFDQGICDRGLAGLSRSTRWRSGGKNTCAGMVDRDKMPGSRTSSGKSSRFYEYMILYFTHSFFPFFGRLHSYLVLP